MKTLIILIILTIFFVSFGTVYKIDKLFRNREYVLFNILTLIEDTRNICEAKVILEDANLHYEEGIEKEGKGYLSLYYPISHRWPEGLILYFQGDIIIKKEWFDTDKVWTLSERKAVLCKHPRALFTLDMLTALFFSIFFSSLVLLPFPISNKPLARRKEWYFVILFSFLVLFCLVSTGRLVPGLTLLF